MSRRRGSAQKERGLALTELIIVVAIGLIVTAMAVPQFISIRRNARSLGDSRDINSNILLAKMRAAARFSMSRVYFDLAAGTFRTEIWNQTATATCAANTWCTEGGATPLSQGVNFGFGALALAPGCPLACTQPAIAQAPFCRPGTAGPPPNPVGGGDIANTACIMFNSRGIPVDNTRNPFGNGAIYITDTVSVYGSTVSATGQTQAWRSDQAAANWYRR